MLTLRAKFFRAHESTKIGGFWCLKLIRHYLKNLMEIRSLIRNIERAIPIQFLHKKSILYIHCFVCSEGIYAVLSFVYFEMMPWQTINVCCVTLITSAHAQLQQLQGYWLSVALTCTNSSWFALLTVKVGHCSIHRWAGLCIPSSLLPPR